MEEKGDRHPALIMVFVPAVRDHSRSAYSKGSQQQHTLVCRHKTDVYGSIYMDLDVLGSKNRSGQLF